MQGEPPNHTMATTSETTPLLGHAPNVEETNTDPNENPIVEDQASLLASAHFKRPRKILSILIVVASLIAGVLLIILYQLLSFKTFANGIWDEIAAVQILMPSLAGATLFAAINLRWNFPTVLNIIVDFCLALNIIPRAADMIASWPDREWCIEHDYYRKNPDQDRGPKCHAMLLTVQILIGFAAALGLVVGICQLILLVLRTVALFRTKFWTMNIPSGSISIEVSVKVRGRDSVAATAGAN